MSENEKHEHEHEHEHEHHHCDKEKFCCDKHEVCEQYEKNVKKIGKIICHKEEEKCECDDKHHGHKHEDDECEEHKGDKCCIIRELFGKEIEEKEERIREALKHLLKNHIKTQLWIDAEEKRLERLECETMKEFNKKAEELFEKLECIEDLEEDYCDALECEKECEEHEEEEDDDEEEHKHEEKKHEDKKDSGKKK